MPSTAISTLSLHDALPILGGAAEVPVRLVLEAARIDGRTKIARPLPARPSIRDQLRIVELDAGERETPGPIVTQVDRVRRHAGDRKSTRLNSSHSSISYAVHRDLHSFPTRRSSDLGWRSRGSSTAGSRSCAN